MGQPDPGDPRRGIRNKVLFITATVVPVVGFMIAVVAWWMVNGVPDGGRGMIGGLLTVIGIAVIAGGYWLADRYWIRKR